MDEDINKKSDEELINLSGTYVMGTPSGTKAQQSQAELNRRLKNKMEELNTSIKNLNKSTDKYNSRLIGLTIILIVLTIMQVMFTVQMTNYSNWLKVVLVLGFVFIIILLYKYSNKLIK